MLDSEIKTYHAAEVSSAATNGGRMSAVPVVSGVVNNVFPHVSRAERVAGSVLHRKIFIKNENDDDETMLNGWWWVERVLTAGDVVVGFAGDQDDTQADIAGSERKYGYGFLQSNITAGDSTFTVVVGLAALASGGDAIFQDGDTIRLTNMQTPDSGTGTEEFLTIDGAPSVTGTAVTITVAETIANSYLAATPTIAMSYLDLGDIACAVADFTVTTAGDGDYDDTTHPLLLDNIGTVADEVTIEFTDATHFTATGASGITYGSGVTSSDFAPSNSSFSKPFFTLAAAGFSGTWAAGDTITFTTTPAARAMWLRRTVPAGCASLANNRVTAVTAAESAT